MANLFSYDSPIIQFLNKAVDCVFLSILWLICSLPIVTMVPATCALYYTVNKVIRHNRSHVFKEFFRSFKSSFKQAFVVGLGLILFYAAIIQNVYMYFLGLYANMGGKTILIINLIMGLCVTGWAIFVITYIARFENKLKVILRNALFISLKHIFVSAILVILICVSLILTWLYFPLIFILPAIYMYIATFLLEPVYRRYMSDEDLEAENERNMVYYN